MYLYVAGHMRIMTRSPEETVGWFHNDMMLQLFKSFTAAFLFIILHLSKILVLRADDMQ